MHCSAVYGWLCGLDPASPFCQVAAREDPVEAAEAQADCCTTCSKTPDPTPLNLPLHLCQVAPREGATVQLPPAQAVLCMTCSEALDPIP